MGPRVLVVRLGALGDLVHTLPAVAAMREAWPDARIDWLVDARYATLLPFVSGVDCEIVIGARGQPETTPHGRCASRDRPDLLHNRSDEAPSSPSVVPDSRAAERSRVAFSGLAGVWNAVRFLRAQSYDVALDAQGLIKSAALARASGAHRVIGFTSDHLREPVARMFYTEAVEPEGGVHVVRKNLALVRALGIEPGPLQFPLDASLDGNTARTLPAPGPDGRSRFAVINPGAGWPNKRWGPDRFGALARHLKDRHGLTTIVMWGPGERELSDTVVRASGGAACRASATGLGELIAIVRRATLFVASDTGPLQIAAALGTPIVSLFGPTDPARNGPWSPLDINLSRFDLCSCHYKRRCRRPSACIDDITLDEVVNAVDRRLGTQAG